MDNRIYEKLKEQLCEELEMIVQRGDVTGSKMDQVDKIVHTMKNIDKLMEGGYSRAGYSQEGSQGSYGSYGSYGGGSYGGGSYGGGSYEGGGSYRGRGMHYVSGHYSHAAGGKREVYDMIEEMISDNRLSADDRRTLKKAQEVLEQK